MTCATLGCGRQTVSSRAKFCGQCFLKSARANSLKRHSFRGGGGVLGNKGGRGLVGNKGNTTAGQSKVNAGEKRKNLTHMICATLGCSRQTASSRAKFCRQCFLKSARANSFKRHSFRGGNSFKRHNDSGDGGVVGMDGRGLLANEGGREVLSNKGNNTTGQSKVNAVEKRKISTDNTTTGQSQRTAGKRSGLKRSANVRSFAPRWAATDKPHRRAPNSAANAS